jgi:hypothetical protein
MAQHTKLVVVLVSLGLLAAPGVVTLGLAGGPVASAERTVKDAGTTATREVTDSWLTLQTKLTFVAPARLRTGGCQPGGERPRARHDRGAEVNFTLQKETDDETDSHAVPEFHGPHGGGGGSAARHARARQPVPAATSAHSRPDPRPHHAARQARHHRRNPPGRTSPR